MAHLLISLVLFTKLCPFIFAQTACQGNSTCATGCVLKNGECEECEPFFYGTNCTTKCSCVQTQTVSCNRENGKCSCKPGYNGTNCDTKCPAFTYGTGCKACPCKKENTVECNYINGSCSCKPGYRGTNCKMRCPKNTFGDGCMNCKCKLENTEVCNFVTGKCTCKAGFMGTNCDQECPSGTYGKECKNNCSCALENIASPCRKTDGACNCKPGYQPQSPVNCSEECVLPYYGQDCRSSCKCTTINAKSCNPFTGLCVCKAGFYATGCDVACRDFTFGDNCSSTCSCIQENSLSCDPVNGTCSCKDGYSSENNCNECRDGYYGPNCIHKCNCGQKQFSVCDKVTGQCLCLPGYGDPGGNCTQECDDWEYGSGCLGRCDCNRQHSLRCDKATGSCICKDGYESSDCTKKSASHAPLVVGLTLTFLFTAIIVGAVLLCMFKNRKRQMKETKDSSPPGTTSNGALLSVRTYQNTSYNNRQISVEPEKSSTEDPLYANTEKGIQQEKNAVYGNVDLPSPSGASAAMNENEYESVARKNNGEFEKTNADLYEALKRQSEPDASTYTKLKFGKQ